MQPSFENQREIISFRNYLTKKKVNDVQNVIAFFEREFELIYHMKQIDHENEALEVDILSYEEMFRQDILRASKLDFFYKLLIKFDEIVQKNNEGFIVDIFYKVFPLNFFPADMQGKPFFEYLKYTQYKDINTSDFDKNIIIKVNKLLANLRNLSEFITNFLTEIILKLDHRLVEVEKDEIELLKASLCYNVLMRKKFILFQYLHLLIKIKYCSRAIKWKEIKMNQLKKDNTFEGLEALHDRISEKDVQFVLKQLTFKKMKDKGDFAQKKNIKSSLDHIDFKQFLIHLIYQLEINLEFIFSGKIRDILKFFESVEEFSKMAFTKVSIDLKCDIFRLIIRISNSFNFISRLELLNYQKLDFFEHHESFKLFYDVYESEIEY